MKEKSTETAGTSSPTWETLEAFARQSVQQFLQRMLEREVDELLARARYERRGPVDASGGYRNGFGKPRRLSLSNGTIVLRRPRVRGLAERFESRLLPAFKRRTEEVGRLLPELYLHGLAQGDFDLALRGLLGDGAPLSAPSIARLKAGWQAEYELWKSRPVADLEVVYVWVDGIYVKAGLEKDKAAMLVVLAALRDVAVAVWEVAAVQSTPSVRTLATPLIVTVTVALSLPSWAKSRTCSVRPEISRSAARTSVATSTAADTGARTVPMSVLPEAVVVRFFAELSQYAFAPSVKGSSAALGRSKTPVGMAANDSPGAAVAAATTRRPPIR
jgi:hypothetical protein